METLVVLLLLVGVVVAVVVSRRNARTRELARQRAELEPVKKLAFEDITALGEQLQELDLDLAGRQLGPGENERTAKATILKAVDRVAEQLNNTRSVCRKYYVHPAVFENYTAGVLLETLAKGNGTGGSKGSTGGSERLKEEEQALVRLLQKVG